VVVAIRRVTVVTGLASAARSEGEEYSIANLEVLVLDISANSLDET